jgi:hypothetical protein
MVRKLFVAVLVLIISVIVVLATIFATQTPTEAAITALRAGDVFTYDIIGFASVNDTNVTIPERFLELNMTEWYRVTVASVSGPELSFNTTWRFINGTEIENSNKINLVTGINNPAFWAMYPANLTTRSLVRPEGSDGVFVNETETRNYKGGARETNIISLQNQFVDTDDPTQSRTYYDYLYVHFDRQTGVLVELRNLKVYSSPEVILTVLWELKASNVWSIS